jgi:CPA1 family monovalent cation:H+ antiporter
MEQASNITQIVAGVVVLLLIASGIHALTKRFKLPFTVVLVLVGVALSSFAGSRPEWTLALHNFQISPDLILYVFLPSLIFEAAFQMDVRQLRENLGHVLMLAVPGLLISTLIIGLIVAAVTGIPFAAALLLGAILSATDPVAVIAVFKRLGAPHQLTTLVEGESLFNDATSIVLSRIMLGVVIGGALSRGSIARGAVSFVAVFVGGLLLGWLLGLLTGLVLGWVQDHFIEITLTTVLAYASFILAEQVVHVSGVMAAIAAGLTISGWGRMRISAPVRAYLERFWEYIAFIVNALIFLMVGLRVDLNALWSTGGLLLVVIAAMLVSRAIVVFGLMALVRKVPASKAFSRAYQTVIFWGGLRGAIALAIVLSLPRFEHGETFIALVMGAVLFTLVVQGLTIDPLVRYLGLDHPLPADRLARLEADFTSYRRALDRMPDLLAGGLFSGAVAMRLQVLFEKKLSAVRTEIEHLHTHELNDDNQQRSLLYLRGLAEEKSLYVDLFDKAQISERAFRRLLLALDLQIDYVRDTGQYEDACPRSARGGRLRNLALKLADRYLAPLAERLKRDLVRLDYEMAEAHYLGSARVLETLDALARLESTPWYIVDKMRRQYRRKYEEARQQLDETASRHPEIVNDLQERAGQALLLLARAESIAEQVARGALPPGVAETIEGEIGDELRVLKRKEARELKVDAIELLRRWPPLQDLGADDLGYIAIRMRLRMAGEHEVVFKQGEAGSSMFFIAHGVVRLSRDENDAARDIATLMAGDFFGEGVLAGKTYRATATAMTPCSLYSLELVDLQIAVESNPAIRQALAGAEQRSFRPLA